jgi:hypothetical protein
MHVSVASVASDVHIEMHNVMVALRESTIKVRTPVQVLKYRTAWVLTILVETQNSKMGGEEKCHSNKMLLQIQHSKLTS